ncbi:type II toxin-antitoxin system HipA family toxin [Ideonella paludis]|uniref:type II toxin-antitoxin system HipA family toxin n=1 Tax=Ideonella paludis TaxID=1233411 RepID=UPI001FE34CFD|nr:type II toxin-antitoxin system HipA family toxin [Ideonella paludis]
MLDQRRVGVLFQYPLSHDQVINRFVADDEFGSDPQQPYVSLSMRAGQPEQQAALWKDVSAPSFNGAYSRKNMRAWLLPAFFQNLLPEGPLRERIAQRRQCDSEDYFEILAATGKDLPGGLHAIPINPNDLEKGRLSRLMTQGKDALEMSVVAQPLEEAASVPGMQAKLAVLRAGDRFVARAKLSEDDDRIAVRHVIAKLPVGERAHLPELEELSLRMAQAAGVSTVEAELMPLGNLAVEHGYDLGEVGEQTPFLAVYRYDRDAQTPTGRVHCEDFAQILGVQPEDKYTSDYLTVAAVMMRVPSLGEAAVHELLRRILVNDLLGNPDMHLKNIGVRYTHPTEPDLPPAYDIVAYSAYGVQPYARALRLFPEQTTDQGRLDLAIVREFCTRLGIPEKPAWSSLKRCTDKARALWPAMIEKAAISERMKSLLLAHLGRQLSVQVPATRSHTNR